MNETNGFEYERLAAYSVNNQNNKSCSWRYKVLWVASHYFYFHVLNLGPNLSLGMKTTVLFKQSWHFHTEEGSRVEITLRSTIRCYGL